MSSSYNSAGGNAQDVPLHYIFDINNSLKSIHALLKFHYYPLLYEQAKASSVLVNGTSATLNIRDHLDDKMRTPTREDWVTHHENNQRIYCADIVYSSCTFFNITME